MMPEVWYGFVCSKFYDIVREVEEVRRAERAQRAVQVGAAMPEERSP